MDFRMTLSRKEWKRRLSPEQFRSARLGVDERPFEGLYWKVSASGFYRCACCGGKLFASDSKYDAGTGHATFTGPIYSWCVYAAPHRTRLQSRTELRCSRCDAHLGYLFHDGPLPVGLRYSINSRALVFEPAGKK